MRNRFKELVEAGRARAAEVTAVPALAKDEMVEAFRGLAEGGGT